MDEGKMFILWITAGVGVLLIYAAYKNISPTSVVTTTLQGASDKAKPKPKPKTPNPAGNDNGGDTSGPQGTGGTVVDSSGNEVSPSVAYVTSPSTYLPGVTS